MNLKTIILITSAAITVPASGVAVAGYSGILNVTTSTGLEWTTTLDSEATLDGGEYWSADIVDDGISVSASMYGSPEDASLGTVLQASNQTAEAMAYDISFTMPLVESLTGPRSWQGSMAASISGENALLTSVMDLSIFEALAGADSLGSMFAAPFELGATGGSTAAGSESAGGAVILTFADSLQAHWQFELGAGTSVMFNGGFGVIPAPGSLVLFACALVVSRRRAQRTPSLRDHPPAL